VKPRADWKNPARIRDHSVFEQFHAQSHDCISCGHGIVVEAHHILSRGRGGDDVLPNLVGLCQECHHAYHGNPYRAFGVRIDANHVRQAIAGYIRSEAGEDTRWYLTGKLGPNGSQVFLERLEGTL
jgi:hypothetical protein